MPRLEASRHIAAPASLVWDLLVDTTQWPTWGPTVRGVDFPERRLFPNATGRVRTIGGISLGFEITSLREGREWTWSVGGIAATGHRIDEVDDSSTLVVFSAPAWAAFYVPVLRLGLRRLAARAEDAVKDGSHAR